MMADDLVKSFFDSMVMDFDKWKDGIGYDVELISRMNDEQRQEVERQILSKGVDDWRDLEALDWLGTPIAHAAIEQARNSGNQELRLAAQRYGPAPSGDDRDAAIVKSLQEADAFEGLSQVLDEAAEHPTPVVVQALLRCARDRDGASAYGAASVLYFIKGKIESHEGFENREFFLRFTEPGDDKDAAFTQLCDELGLHVEA